MIMITILWSHGLPFNSHILLMQCCRGVLWRNFSSSQDLSWVPTKASLVARIRALSSDRFTPAIDATSLISSSSRLAENKDEQKWGKICYSSIQWTNKFLYTIQKDQTWNSKLNQTISDNSYFTLRAIDLLICIAMQVKIPVHKVYTPFSFAQNQSI